MVLIQLEFLTNDDKTIQLCKLYWEVDDEQNFTHSVSSLAGKFGMSSRDISKVVKQCSKAFSPKDTCPRCETPHSYTNRSDFQQTTRYSNKSRICTDCIEKENEIKKAERLAELQQQRETIREKFALRTYELIDIRELSFEDAIYLLSFIRAMASEDFTSYGPLNSITESLSPRENYSIEIIRRLFKDDLIAIHPNTPPDVFTFQDGDPIEMTLSKVIWTLSVGNGTKDTHFIVSQLEGVLRERNWPETWQDEYLSLWQKVALQECLEYLELVLSEHKLPLNPGEKTLSVLANLLEEYSVSQIYSLIWSAGKDAAAFYLRERVTKQHAANTVIGRMQRHGDRARAEGWHVKSFRRDRRCPESVVSQVLSSTALHIGEAGFNEPPHLID